MDVAARTAELDRLHRGLKVRRTRSLLASWAWRFFAPPRAVAVEPLPTVAPGEVAVTFGGHATALIRYAGCGIALDPMLGRWVGGVHRAVAPGLGPAELATAAVVLVSHAHADHLHLASLAKVPAGATVVGPLGLAARLGRHRFARVIELDGGAGVELDAVRIDAAAVAHGAGELGPTLAFTITGDGPRVFACADGGYGDVFARVGAAAPPDVALLPIGGYWPRGFRARHLSPLDALYAFEDLKARVMVPIHHGAFALSYERLDEPVRWLEALVAERALDDHVRVLAPGQSAVWRGARRVAPPSSATTEPSAAAVATGPWATPPVTLGSPRA